MSVDLNVELNFDLTVELNLDLNVDLNTQMHSFMWLKGFRIVNFSSYFDRCFECRFAYNVEHCFERSS